jgi:hypothetical protein
MRISRSATVIGAAAVLVGGATVGVHAAGGNENVRLCVPKAAGAVTVADPCPTGTRAVQVPASSAVDALQSSVAALQAQVDQQGAKIATLQNRLAAVAKLLADQDPGVLDVSANKTDFFGEYQVHATGSALEPGANVRMQTKVMDISMGAVAPDGSFSSYRVSLCSQATLPWTFTSTTALGNPVTTQITSCP